MTTHVDLTIARLSVRQLLTLKSAFVVLLFASLPVLLAALSYLRSDPVPLEIVVGIYSDLLFPVVLPIVALLFGTGVFGAETEDGTIVYLLTKPMARWRIMAAKLITAAGLAAIFTAGPALLAGLVVFRGLDPDRVVIGFTVATAFGAVLYTTIFMTLRFFVRRAIIVGLAYVVIWEQMAVTSFPGVRNFSVSQYAFAVADAIALTTNDLVAAAVPITTAWPMALGVLALGTTVSLLRVRSLEIANAE